MSSSSPTPSLRRRSSLKDYFSSSIPRLPSLRSRRSNASISSVNHERKDSSSSYAPYAVHNQAMAPAILRDANATSKLLECILETPGGKRSLARLARTCKAFKEPVLDILWRDLETFVPLLTLFPNTLLKRARRPALGLAKNPEGDDWERLLAYGERVRSISYVEAFNTLSQSVFPVFEACPGEFLLPNLTTLTWKAETTTGLNFCRAYLSPKLHTFTLEMGVRAPKINDFLDEVMSRTQLVNFSFTLHSNLPENFVEKVRTNNKFEKLAIMAPGALAARVGKWASSLPLLKTIALDLSNTSSRAVEGFFAEVGTGSGYSTPESTGRDSGVFSGEDDIDFTDVRKSIVRLTSDGPRHSAFPQLTQINLTGEAANIATFLRHITSPLSQIELAIEDPPLLADWHDLCALLGNHFGTTLQAVRINATGAARFNELVRSTSRAGDVQLQHLPLTHLGPLPYLYRFEIELPESAVFYNNDLAHLAKMCPNLEVARLCGQVRFAPQFGPPPLTLEGIIPLTSACPKLHTLAVVVHALGGHDETFRVREHSSRSLMRLNVGHSWIKDPLATAILLSHIAPHLETLRWFAQANRAGAVEKHAETWQRVQTFLPQLQKMRLIERSLMPKPVVIEPPKKASKEVDATPQVVHRGTTVKPDYADESAQIESPEMVEEEVQVVPETSEMEIDATPVCVEVEVGAVPEVVEQSVEAIKDVEDKAIDAIELQVTPTTPIVDPLPTHTIPPLLTSFVPSINGIVSLPFRAVRVYTYYLSLPLRYMFSFGTPLMPALSDYASNMQEPKSPASAGENATSEKPMSPMPDFTLPENGSNAAAMPRPTSDASVTTVGH
ncbi:hypothetical protein PHLGIDRAFT_498684 [Phlebiopsis gigantea 11061_1 CR5-6]|uniref:F-box domain-containing protein n=1 Tax=Phlebiopsis gigantea (strain 11061_1 CR5-6) TaxID=745531 RepID=A0A0C3P3N8_PHLG1|nr:hypothetical protein PHLGIDRAFT_498684 [Phlebiopsis gigantea 11061_1 CR5-6]